MLIDSFIESSTPSSLRASTGDIHEDDPRLNSLEFRKGTECNTKQTNKQTNILGGQETHGIGILVL